MEDRNLFDMQEKEWIELAQKDDLEAFNHLVLAYQDAAFSLASWMLKDDSCAEDIVQEAFITAFCHIRQFRGSSFRAWLLRIIRNACIDELRRYSRHPWIPLEPVDEDGESVDEGDWIKDHGALPEELTIEKEGLRKIEQCIQQLADPLREVLILVDIEAYNYEEAATVLNIPLGTIKSRLARARAGLRELLEVHHHLTAETYASGQFV
jgi:RNA polymerase sigma-70 factor (ECF subfamily)